jgi:cytochrome c oxidase subunit 2
MRFGRMAGAVTVALVVGACGLPNFGAPDAVSEQGRRTLSLWRGTFVAALVVGAIVMGLILFTIVRYRRRDDRIPHQGAHNVPLEVVYTSIPVAIVAVLFAVNVVVQGRVTDLADRPDVTVEVVGFQWQWQFRYPDEGVTVTGGPESPAPELVLPAGRTTRLQLSSDDVIHSFWVPDFLTKRDLVPGLDNEIDVTPERPGRYVGRCAEYCGLDHWRMRFAVRVVSPGEFDRWLDQQRAASR